MRQAKERALASKDLSPLVCPGGGAPRILTRGNDDVGSSSVLCAYPRSDVVIVVLSHAGIKAERISWSSAVHGRLEALPFPTPERQ